MLELAAQAGLKTRCESDATSMATSCGPSLDAELAGRRSGEGANKGGRREFMAMVWFLDYFSSSLLKTLISMMSGSPPQANLTNFSA